jgi:hypothetical protein
MPAYPSPSCSPFAAAESAFSALQMRLKETETLSLQHDDVEVLVETQGAEILRHLLQGHLDLRAVADAERAAPRDAQQVDRTHRRRTSRPLATVFGDCLVHRLSFTARGASGGLCPLDAELNLPSELYSLTLRRRAAELAMDGSFEAAGAKLASMTARPVGKRQVEQLVVRAAQDFEAFYDERQDATVCQEPGRAPRELLVLSTDGKGIVMRPEGLRAATAKKAAQSTNKLKTRLSSGEKRNRKRMAEVATVYELERRPRTPDDILPPPVLPDATEKTPERAARPRPVRKRVWASVTRPMKEVVEQCFEEALSRDPHLERTWVYLADGNRDQLRLAQEMAGYYGVELTVVVDFIHVLEYLWKAAWSFHDTGDPEAEEWVLERARAVLQGKASHVAAGIRRSATLRELDQDKRKGADKCATYLVNNAVYLRYDSALDAGFPIATGVIEGACRHLVNDRLAITGARWGLEGAEAMLRLRALRASRDFDEYWQFHRQRELHRNHLKNYAANDEPRVARAS